MTNEETELCFYFMFMLADFSFRVIFCFKQSVVKTSCDDDYYEQLLQSYCFCESHLTPFLWTFFRPSCLALAQEGDISTPNPPRPPALIGSGVSLNQCERHNRLILKSLENKM